MYGISLASQIELTCAEAVGDFGPIIVKLLL